MATPRATLVQIEPESLAYAFTSRRIVMTRRSLVGIATAIVAGLAASCGGNHLTGPGGTVGPGSLKIQGVEAIAPGQIVAFVATASLSDGTTQDYTRKVVWSTDPTSVMTINQYTGVATAVSVGDVTITAAWQGGTTARITRTVLPANTFRLTGKALESGLPVQGATIAVLSGTGAGLSTTTDANGCYRLYGVAGVIQVKFSKPGYDDLVKTFTAAQNDVLDFPQAHQTAAIPSLAGTYALTLTADPACPTVPVNRYSPLPDDFRQPRSYAVSLTQDGPSLTVTLTDAQIATGQNHFTGRVEPDAIEFQIGSYDYYYGLTGGVAEQLSTTQEFVFGGQLHAHRSGSAMTGPLDGALEILGVPGNGISAQCVAHNNQVTLAPVAQPSRHR
jgi:hypothetical protein